MTKAATYARRLALAVVTLAVTAGCGGKSDADAVAAAKKALANRNPAAAVIELKSVLQHTPNNGEARYLLGTALGDQGDCPAALLELRKSQDQGFDENLLAPRLARCLVSTGKFKDVVQSYSGIKLRTASEQAELSTALALAQFGLGQTREAEAALADALSADPKHPWALVSKARLLARGGKYEEALALVDKAVGVAPNNGDAYLLRATILRFGKRDTQRAIADYQTSAQDPLTAIEARTGLIQLAIIAGNLAEAKLQLAQLQKSHPTNPLTLYVAAIVAYFDKDFARVEVLVDSLLRVAPDNLQSLVLGGAANLQRGNFIAAEAKLGKVVQTIQDVPLARNMLAETYVRSGRSEKALSTLQPLLQQDRADASALALAGQAHLQAGNPQEAEKMFAAALKAKPDDPQIRTAMALTNLAKGAAESAIDTLQGVAAKDPGDTADLALISVQMRRRDFDAALAAIARLEAKSPNKSTASHLRGLALRDKGDLAGARMAFEKALQLSPSHYASIAALATLDVQEGKFDAARARLDKTIKSDPRNSAARMALLDVMSRQGAKPADLLLAIDTAVQATPNEAPPHLAKIRQLTEMNDVKGAAAAAQNALAALPQNPDLLDAGGRALANSGEFQQAISTFNKLVSVQPGSALPHLRIADVYFKSGDLRAGWSALARAFDVAPLSTEVHRRLQLYVRSSKDFKSVLDLAKGLQKSQPAVAAGYLLEGDIEVMRKGWGAALAAYRTAIDKKGTGASLPQRAVYTTLIASGERVRADRFALEWLQAHPKDSKFKEHLAGEALARKDFATAEGLYGQVLAIEPTNVAALNNLAWLLAQRESPDSMAAAEKALALAPDSPPILDTLAKAQASAGKLDRAIESQRKAVALMPGLPLYRINLALLYAKAGKRTEAAAELDTLVRLGDKVDQAEVARIRKLLES